MVVLIEPDGDVEERYDYENRLVKITDGVYNIAEYTYDALGRRIEMKTYDSGEVDSTTRYYYNNWQVLAETDYDSTGPTETQLRDYIYGNYIDEVLIMTDDSDAKHYYAITFDFVICHSRESGTRSEAKSRDSESSISM